MSRIAKIVEQIQDTQAAAATLEKAVAATPRSVAVALSLQSVQKRAEELEAEFLKLTNESHLDVCSYRLFAEEHPAFKISSLGNAMVNFQNLFSVVFDALKNGPKQISRIDAAVASETAFEFGYTFSGSVGLVFTMPNERLLVGESDLDAAMRTVFEMAQSRDSAKIAAFAKRLGAAPVRKLYRWAEDLALAGMGADIRWQREQTVKDQVFIQPKELVALKDAIAATSDETERTIEITGILLGFDVRTRRFHLEVEGAEDIRGEVSPKIGTKLTVDLGTRYKADVLVKKSVHYATETEEASFFMLALTPCGEQKS